MSVHLYRYNWTTQVRERIPVSEAVLQEMVDALFARNEAWALDLDHFRRQIRNWQGRLETVDPEPQLPSGDTLLRDLRIQIMEEMATGDSLETVCERLGLVELQPVAEPSTWPTFLAAQRKEGKTPQEASVAWKARSR